MDRLRIIAAAPITARAAGLRELVSGVAERPAMYTGQTSLELVALDLSGLDAGLRMADPAVPGLAQWGQRVEMRFDTCHAEQFVGHWPHPQERDADGWARRLSAEWVHRRTPGPSRRAVASGR